MAKSIKLQNDNYWDSSGITHNRQKINELLNSISTSISNLSKEKGYITCGLNGNTDFTVSSSWQNYDLSLNLINYTNNKFTLKNGYVTIPEGVTKIRVSGQFMSMGIVGYQYCGIWHNNKEITAGYYRATNASFFGTITFAPIVLTVKPGDTIKLRYGAGAAGTLNVAGGQYTKLNIEEV